MSRLETGVYRHTPDDWQGLFIRGDACFAYALYLEAAIEALYYIDPLSAGQLRELLSLLKETRE